MLGRKHMRYCFELRAAPAAVSVAPPRLKTAASLPHALASTYMPSPPVSVTASGPPWQAYEARRAAKDAERDAQEAAQEAEIARAAEERRRREEEEAAKWMHLFSVEAAGEEALSQEEGEVRGMCRGQTSSAKHMAAGTRGAFESEAWRGFHGVCHLPCPSTAPQLCARAPSLQSLQARFIDYIKARKTVALDELAAEFGMRTQVGGEGGWGGWVGWVRCAWPGGAAQDLR